MRLNLQHKAPGITGEHCQNFRTLLLRVWRSENLAFSFRWTFIALQLLHMQLIIKDACFPLERSLAMFTFTFTLVEPADLQNTRWLWASWVRPPVDHCTSQVNRGRRAEKTPAVNVHILWRRLLAWRPEAGFQAAARRPGSAVAEQTHASTSDCLHQFVALVFDATRPSGHEGALAQVWDCVPRVDGSTPYTVYDSNQNKCSTRYYSQPFRTHLELPWRENSSIPGTRVELQTDVVPDTHQIYRTK